MPQYYLVDDIGCTVLLSRLSYSRVLFVITFLSSVNDVGGRSSLYGSTSTDHRASKIYTVKLYTVL